MVFFVSWVLFDALGGVGNKLFEVFKGGFELGDQKLGVNRCPGSDFGVQCGFKGLNVNFKPGNIDGGGNFSNLGLNDFKGLDFFVEKFQIWNFGSYSVQKRVFPLHVFLLAFGAFLVILEEFVFNWVVVLEEFFKSRVGVVVPEVAVFAELFNKLFSFFIN